MIDKNVNKDSLNYFPHINFENKKKGKKSFKFYATIKLPLFLENNAIF